MKKKSCSIIAIAIATACFCSSSIFAAEAKKAPAKAPPADTTKEAVATTPSNKLMSPGEYTIGMVIDHPKQLALISETHGKWIITPAPGILGILKTAGIKKCHALVTIDAEKTAVISFHAPSDKKALASYPEKHAVKIKPTDTADAATTAKSKPKAGV